MMEGKMQTPTATNPLTNDLLVGEFIDHDIMH